jgi:AhpD family alkylhydroperoxidase
MPRRSHSVTGIIRSCGKSAGHWHPTSRPAAGPTVRRMRFDPYTADPDAYGHAFRLGRHLAGCPLDPAIRNLVELRASQINGCAFCLDLHSVTARHAEVAQRKLDMLAGWREAPDFSPRERAALALAEEMVRIGDGNNLSDATWACARAEFDDDEIAGLLYTIGLIGFWNTLNVAVEFPPEAPLPRVR